MATDATEFGRVILAAVIPGRRDLLDHALRKVLPEHFIDPQQRLLFQLLERYLQVTHAVLPRDALESILRDRADPAKVLLMGELYDSLAVASVAEDAFLWALEQIVELSAERATAEALTAAMEALRTGIRDAKGELLQGHTAARTVALTRFAEIERDIHAQDAPEGNMRTEGSELLQDYARQAHRHAQGLTRGIGLGVTEIDNRTGGFNPGELVLMAGFSSDGKSTLCAQGSWAAAVEQGKNVVVLTTETVRDQFRRKIVARHSKLPQWGLSDGITTQQLKNGTVPQELLGHLQAIVNDLTGNPGYGQLYIAQVPRGATIATCEARLYRIQRQFNIDIVYFDYLALLRADVRYASSRESLAEILKEAKQVATTFDHGRGIPLVSPWQVNRTAKEYADQHGSYLPEHMAETAEATNSADVICSILSNKDKDHRLRDVLLQILKNRDGETALMSPLPVRCDYATCWFGRSNDAQVHNSLESMAASGEVSLGAMA